MYPDHVVLVFHLVSTRAIRYIGVIGALLVVQIRDGIPPALFQRVNGE